MGKQSRRKKHKKKWVRKTPDEVIARGPLRIEIYGKRIRFSNTSTPEQHAAFLERTKEANKSVLADLGKEVATLQSFVGKYDPVFLMYRAAYMLLPLFIKYRSENEFQGDEGYALPIVEYLQYLIARTDVGPEDKEPSEDEWNTIWNTAMKVMRLTQTHLMTRETRKQPPDELDKLRLNLDGRRLMIRVKRYPIFFSDHLRSALSPYESQIKEIYGVSVEKIITELGKIDEYQKTGVIRRYRDFRNATYILTEKLREKGYAVDPGISEEEIKRTRAALESPEFKSLHGEVEEKARLTLTPAIFEITDLTNLPKPLLSLLSVRPGESILKTLTGPDYDDLSPLSPSVLHNKPFLEIGGKFYTFYHSGFEDHIADIIEADMFDKRLGQISVMAKKRSDRLESDAKELIASIIHPDFAFQNLYYPDPSNGNLTELDVLMEVDDVLFIIEAKAGGFSKGASRGAPDSLAQELSDLIMEGQRQSERVEQYIKSTDEVAFFDEGGKKEVFRIKRNQFRKIVRVVITREDLGWIGAKIAILSILDPSFSKSYPWHISIDDLRIVADLFRDDPIRFVHYLELRLMASAETTLTQNDEIEHIGLYNKINFYFDLPVQGIDQLTFDPSYMRDIDYYFMEKARGGSPQVPTQNMPTKVREFIANLNISRLPHRFEVGSIVLSMGKDGRNNFEKSIDMLDAGMAEGRQRTIRLPFTSIKLGLSVSCAEGPNWNEELKKSAIQMEQGGCNRWLVVRIGKNREVLDIELILPGRFTEADLLSAREYHESKAKIQIAKQKPGRNDQCPCGSGKKYKKCHGY